MKMKGFALLLAGLAVLLSGCSSDIDKCVKAVMKDRDLDETAARLLCMRAAKGQ